MMTQTRLLLIALLALAGLLTLWQIPLASSQGVTLVAAAVSAPLPVDDLDSTLWREATAISVPLSAQIVARPIFPQANVRSIAVRALHNDEQIAFLLEWADDTMDDSAVRVQDFADSVALQFPLVAGQPFFCMGQQGGDVNIWHWKADWQATMLARQDVDTVYPHMYVDNYPFADEEAGAAAPVTSYVDENYVTALAAGNLFAYPSHATPVEDLISGGFGLLTAKPAEMQNVWGHGEYADGKWRVIFARDLVTGEADDAQFEAGQVYFVAFAAWDGANDERDGQKSTSQWVSLQLGDEVTVDDAPAERPIAPDAPDRQPTPASLEGFLYAFAPMVIVIGLILLLTAGVWLFARLPDKR